MLSAASAASLIVSPLDDITVTWGDRPSWEKEEGVLGGSGDREGGVSASVGIPVADLMTDNAAGSTATLGAHDPPLIIIRVVCQDAGSDRVGAVGSGHDPCHTEALPALIITMGARAVMLHMPGCFEVVPLMSRGQDLSREPAFTLAMQ
jgi:hypothetical protein